MRRQQVWIAWVLVIASAGQAFAQEAPPPAVESAVESAPQVAQPAPVAEPAPTVEPVVTPVVEIAAQPASARRYKLTTAILWSASVAAFAIGTGFGVSALKAKNDFEDKPSFRLADRADDHSMVADLSIGVGISFALLGAFTFFSGRSEQANAVALTPVMSPRSVGAAATTRF